MSPGLKITLSVNGRFHAFDFAAALEARNSLGCLMTSYPSAITTRMAGLPSHKVRSLPWPEALRRLHHAASSFLPLGNPQFFLNASFDRWASQQIPEGTNIFVGWSGNSLLSVRRAKERKIPTFLERHSAHIETQTEWLADEYRKFGLAFHATHPRLMEQELREYEAADWISVPSRFVRRTFLDKGVSEAKIRVHPLAVDTEKFRPVPHRSKKLRFFYGGQLSLRKGIPYLVEAFQNLGGREAELFLVGDCDPELEPILARFASEGIVRLPAQSSDRFAGLLASSDLVCVPSIEDGFNQVAVQAMACGVPVLASTNTGAGELVDEGRSGFLVPPCDARAICDRMEWALSNRDDLGAMGEFARSRMVHTSTWARYAESRIEEFAELLETGSLTSGHSKGARGSSSRSS